MKNKKLGKRILSAILVLLMLVGMLPGAFAASTELEVRFVVDGDLYAYDTIASGEVPELPATEPVKEGYTFSGWMAESDSTVYTGALGTITGNETYVAQFEADQHTLTYYRGAEADASDYKCVLTLDSGVIVELYNNDGTDHPTYEVANITYGTTVVLGEAVLPGYTFAGWKDAAGYTHPAGASYVVKDDITLTAVWTEADDKIDCLVQYVSEGKVVESFLAYDGQTIVVIAGSSVAGKIFRYWENDGANYLAGNEVDVVAGAERSMIFTAVYEDALYDVTYTGDNDAATDEKDLPYGAYVLADAPTKDDFLFVAWEDVATGAYYDAKAEITLDEDKEFVAVWTAESIGTNIVKFYAEDGSLFDFEIVDTGNTVIAPVYTAGKIGVTYQWIDDVNNTFADEGDSITVDKDVSYQIKVTGEAEYQVNVSVEPAINGVATAPTKEYKLGEIVDISVKVPDGYLLKAVSAVGTTGTPVVDSLVKTAEGEYVYYITMPAEDISVSVELEAVPIGSTVVKFMSDSALYDYVIVVKGTNGAAPAIAPVKEGYTFVEWKNGTTVVDPGAAFAVEATASDEIVFEAVWSQDQYLVNYDTLGGLPSPTAVNQYYGDAITLADAPVLDGNEFVGWIEESTGFVYAAGATYTIKGDVKFTAKWEVIPPNEYTVRFVDEESNQIFGFEIVKDGNTIVAPTGPSFEGKTFSHWEDAHGAKVMAGAATPVITADTTYYAKYDVNTHGVTSVTEQCVVTPSSMSNVAVGTLVEFEVAANDKYSVESVSISYNDGMTVVIKELIADEVTGKYSFYMPDAEVTITAIAAQSVFSIYKNPETYTLITAADTAEAGESVVFTVESTDEDYLISNVYVETVSGTPVAVSTLIVGTSVNYIFAMPADDVRITAQAEQTAYTVTFLDADNTLLGIEAVGSGDLATAPVAAKDGYSFDGWEILPGNAAFDPATDVVTADLVVRATYVGNPHTVAAGLIDNVEALSAKCTISTGNTNSSDLLQTVLDAETGETVYFTVSANFGYDITDIAVVSATGTNLVVEPVLREKETVDNIVYYTYSFTMPAEDVKLDIYTVPQAFKVSVTESIAEGGEYTINGYYTSNLMIAQGEQVSIIAMPAAGYTVTDITGNYIDNLGNVSSITGTFDAVSGTFTFDMIAKDVDVTITYEANIYNIDIQTSNFESYKPDASVNPAVVVESLDAALTSKGLIELVGGSTENYTNAAGQIYVIPSNGTEIVGTQIGFAVKEYTGYDLAALTVTYNGGTESCALTEKDGVYYFKLPADDVVIIANFIEETYKVTKNADSEANGTVVVNGLKENSIGIDYKDTVTVEVTPEAGYQITKIYYVLADATVMDFDAASYAPTTTLTDALDTKQSITFHMPASNVEIFAEYEKINYTVSANYTAEEVDVTYTTPHNVGDQVSFTTAVKHGYFIDKVYVIDDTTGKKIDCFTETTSEEEIYGATYQFEMPASSVTIHVVTVKDEYVVKYYDAGGLVGYEDVKYKAAANVDEYIPEVVNAKDGYHFIGWYSADVETPVDISAPSINKNDFIVVKKTNIRAVYAKDEIDVVFNATENGTVICNGNNAAYTLDTTVFGDTVNFTVTPDKGYVVDTVSVTTTDKEGYNLDVRYTEKDGEYTFVIPATYKNDVHTVQAEDIVVSVTFKKDMFTLTKGACDSEGVIAVNGEVATETVYNYLYQDEVTITATPESGYYVSKIAAVGDTESFEVIGTAPVADAVVGEALTLSFKMPAEDLTYTVEYEKIVFDIATVFDATQGKVETVPALVATINEQIEVTVTPEYGYVIDNVFVATASDEHIALSKDSDGKYHFTMPAEDVIVTATFIKEVYTVTFKDWNGDILEVDYVDYLEAATAPVDPAREGYTFIGWDADFSSVTTDLLVTAQYEIITSNLTAHAISFTGAVRGTVELSAEVAKYGDVVEIICNPDDGYRFESISIKTTNGEYISAAFVKTEADYVTTYSFVMPDCDVDIYVSFTKYASSKFDDVRTDFWFYDAVNFVTDRGYFVGVSKNLFAPQMKMTRSMFVAVLARMNGVDLSAYNGTDFMDVSADAYYAPAVKWASENGIVKGYSETIFAPDDSITREQMCAIMYRYCDYADIELEMKNEQFMDRYIDLDEISPYAADAVEWAVGTGLILGTSKKQIDPKGVATRAQVAQIIKNFSDKVVHQ